MLPPDIPNTGAAVAIGGREVAAADRIENQHSAFESRASADTEVVGGDIAASEETTEEDRVG